MSFLDLESPFSQMVLKIDEQIKQSQAKYYSLFFSFLILWVNQISVGGKIVYR